MGSYILCMIRGCFTVCQVSVAYEEVVKTGTFFFYAFICVYQCPSVAIKGLLFHEGADDPGHGFRCR